METLDLIAEDSTTRDMWVESVQHLVATVKSLGQQKEYEM